ncbi:hypothetical protein BGZ74_008487 [Mortierella antarctica]|nr:hypothetical protein BGZ74_008487 [Mortierella antarctica]
MAPWRALGMLAFGLAIIFMFVRLHGDGYDFPVKVTKLKDELEFPRQPDRTYLEVSSLYPQDEEDQNAVEDGDRIEEVPVAGSGSQGQKFKVGWNSQWHLGKKKKAVPEEEEQQQQQQPPQEATVVERSKLDPEQGSKDSDGNERWVWMTNIWYNDGECGAGHLRQYRRRLGDVMAADNSTKWELMYTHKLPGPITHSSLSRRVTTQDKDGANHKTESIRLAVVYKVVEDEHAAYHSRVYRFGVYQEHADLREDCGPISTETCHRYRPFLNYNYVLPGTTLIKEFTLEHDMILYARLSDTALFRALLLPKLKPGSTSPARPFALSSGALGPVMVCAEKKLVTQRTSFFVKVPSRAKSNDLNVLMAHVQENRERDVWDYQVSVRRELTEAMTGIKKWLPEEQRWISFGNPSITHETDMIMDEPYTYGTAVQNPYVVKAADGTSFHMPVKGTIVSLENSDRTWSRDKSKGKNDPSLFQNTWGESVIDQSLSNIITEQGVINDANDIMVLKTSGNSILVLKREFLPEDETRISTPWHLALIMRDEYYDPTSPSAASRNVLAMRIVQARPTAAIKAAEQALAEMMNKKVDDEGDVTGVEGAEELKAIIKDKAERNILLMVFGDGKIVGYDLDRTTEASPVLLFLQEKYPVVIGMLAVVVAFVINEAR